jgi:hypothetical protein
MGGSTIWAITSYFNPAGYRRKIENYRMFRGQLNVPLVAVELSYTGLFELQPGDADILVGLRGSDVMWQKERLLNVALDLVPRECEAVAWLDCDVIFGRQDWAQEAAEKLDRFPVCQLYSEVYHLGPDKLPAKENAVLSNRSFAWALTNGRRPEPECVYESAGFQRGHAWAARRSLLDQMGLYDRGIIGGGDKLIAFAAIGRARDAAAHNNFGPEYTTDFLEWANAFHEAVGPCIGCLDVNLFHLWHGEIRDRGYTVRQAVLAENGYDPRTDIALDSEGCWRWNSPKHEMHRRIREYFHSRMEDGRHAFVAGSMR